MPLAAILRFLVCVAAAFGIVVGVELLAGPFGDIWDGLFGIATGVLCLVSWFTWETNGV